MRRISLFNLGALVAAIALFITFIDSPATAQPQKPFEIEILTVTAGTVSHMFGATWAQLINKNSTRVKATVIEGMGPMSNTKVLALEPNKRSNTVILDAPSSAWWVENGRIKGVPAYFGERQLAAWTVAGNGFISINPNIKTIKDFEGKRVGLGSKFVYGISSVPLAIIKQEVPEEKMKIDYLDPIKGMDALRDGLIDVYYAIGATESPTVVKPAPPVQAFLDITKDKPQFISFNKDKVITGLNSLGGYASGAFTVAPKTYHAKQESPWTLLAGTLTWAVDKSFPDEVAYEIVKIFLENQARFVEVHPNGKFISKETIGLVSVPENRVHPGALRYFKENGIRIGSFGVAPELNWAKLPN